MVDTKPYYKIIVFLLQDSGVSVRKRVIKILKDICVLQPDFPKINEICMIILRRIQIDEESIKVCAHVYVCVCVCMYAFVCVYK